MITFLTTFKPFAGDDAVRQRNAIFSWLALGKEVEIIVFGSAPGTSEIASELGLVHCQEKGWGARDLPTIDILFKVGQQRAKHDLLTYINGDMVLGPDFCEALFAVPLRRFLLLGRRWDADLLRPIESPTPACVDQFRRWAKTQGRWHEATGMDYFAFRRGTLADLPPLVVGAALWDTYMVYHCKKRHIPVIDATKDIFAVHQNHPYTFSPNGQRTTVDSPAAQHNRAILTPLNLTAVPYITLDASHIMQGHTISRLSIPHLRHQIEIYPVRHPQWARFAGMFVRVSKGIGLAEKVIRKNRID